MSNIPYQLIFRRIENMMYRNGELNYTEARAQMSARNRDRVNNFGAHFIR